MRRKSGTVSTILRAVAVAAVVLAFASCGQKPSGQAPGPGVQAPGTGQPAASRSSADPGTTPGDSSSGGATAAPGSPALPQTGSSGPASPTPAASPPPAAPVNPQTGPAAPSATAPTVDYAVMKNVTVPDPKILLPSGVYLKGQTVQLGCDLKEALIRYTLDGSSPGPGVGFAYSGPVKLDATAAFRTVAYIPGGKSSAIVSAEFSVGEVHVGGRTSGAGAENGTRAAPFGAVSRGLSEALAKGADTVKVAAGTYTEKIDITGNVTIRGGYSSDFSERNPAANVSILAAPETAGATQIAPGYAIRFSGALVGQKTLLEGMTIRGGDAAFATAVLTAEQAAPLIRDCMLAGGFGSYSYGLRALSKSSPRLERCRIDGGEGGSSFGVSADSSVVICISSTIAAGTGTVVSYGFSLTGSRAQVSGCAVDGGKANASYGVALYSAAGVALNGCTLSGGAGKTAYAVFIASSDPEIRNCIIFARGSAKSYGVYENYGDSDPKALEANCFFDSATGIYFDEDTKKTFAGVDANGQLVAAEGTLMTTPRGLRNIVERPALQAAPDFRPSGGLPASVTQGGVASPAGFDLDRDGKKRSAPYSIGAYEID
ncbi:MAG: chitobiase/beta-hexosaminidase C-terminal domain-containing protein [Spirochaetes bacterium]|nr:chitobiase/beta-hexosaminidase C-terminal domain-containing protein [Spirochaetota bacterium]